MENNLIKSITTHICPHCKEEIFVESSMQPPTVNSLFTAEEIKQAKKDCLDRIVTLSISDEKKDSVTKWVNDPNTVFGLGEVDSIILSLLENEE